MKKVLLSLLILFLAGCSTTITSLSGYLPDREVGSPYHTSVDNVLRYYFTDEAYNILKDIPMRSSLTIGGGGYAAGTTWLSSLAEFLSLNGWGRKVILNEDWIRVEGVATILHEYFHHLDDMGRDGEITPLVNLEEFQEAYTRCFYDTRYHGITEIVEMRANGWFTTHFGIGECSEHMAYTLSICALQNCPPYLGRVFRRVLRRFEEAEGDVITSNETYCGR